MDDKVIVTHRGALKGKYGTKGLAKIRAAIAKLVAADKKRGVKTGVVYLDDARVMKKMGAKTVGQCDGLPRGKAAIDGVFKSLTPDYLMILGAPDVVPHQDLTNPAFDPSPSGDDDRKGLGRSSLCL